MQDLNDMNRRAYFLILFSLFWSCTNCNKSPDNVVLFEDKFYTITTSKEEYNIHLSAWLKKYPHLKKDDQLNQLFGEISKRLDDSLVNAFEIANRINLSHRLIYITGALIQTKKAVAINKLTKKQEIINVSNYSSSCCTGRIFKINNYQLFEITDTII